MRHYIDKRDKAWVEELDDRVVVSWPGGQRILSYDEPVPNLLAAIREAVISLMEEEPDDRTIKQSQVRSLQRGLQSRLGKTASEKKPGKRVTIRAAVVRGTVRTVDTGTKL